MILGGMQREGEAPPLPSVLCNNTPLAPHQNPGGNGRRGLTAPNLLPS